MHRRLLYILFVFSLLTIVFPFVSVAQTTYTDQMVRDHIDLRRKEQIYESQRSKSGKSKKTSKKTTTKPAIRPVEINFGMDMYHPLPEGKSITILLTFTPAGQSAKAFTREHTLTRGKSIQVTGIPVGSYIVTAHSNGEQILLGTECGGPTDPNGGNFSASQRIQITPGKDYYGKNALKSSPSLLYMRVQ